MATPSSEPPRTTGDKQRARDVIAAIRTLKQIETERRPATEEEKSLLRRFMGFGPVARVIFPDPVTGRYKDASWQVLGEELKSLLNDEEYASAKRTTYNAFYTSPVVMQAMHAALERLGVPANATILEPGCGPGRFIDAAESGHRFIGIELDSLSGRIAQALHPKHDIRIENFRDSRLPEGRIGAVIGNVPFGDVTLDYRGGNYSLHDYFFVKSLDALKPGGVMALVTSRYTLDKLNGQVREALAEDADFLGAIRLPSDSFQAEGTKVVTDIVFLRKRTPGEPAHHVDDEWLETGSLALGDTTANVNRYFLNHPEMVLGAFSPVNTLYGEGFSVERNGDLKPQLAEAIERLPKFTAHREDEVESTRAAAAFVPPPASRHIDEGSFFVGEDQAIYQRQNGEGVPVVYGGTALRAGGTMVGRRMAALIGLRDQAREVLRSQNEGWPVEHRDRARQELRRGYDRYVSAFGPINKTTLSESKDGTVIRRMPNLVKFREDPDAFLVCSLEDYDDLTDTAKPAAILLKDVVGPTPAVRKVASAEEGLLVSLNTHGKVDLDFIAGLYPKPPDDIIKELGDLIYREPESREWQTADEYLSGDVRQKLAVAVRAGAEFVRNERALRVVQPPDVLPGDIDGKLGAPWIPASDVHAFAAELFRLEPASIPVDHLKQDAVWSVTPDYFAKSCVATTTEYGTARANGTWLLELALNMKSPTIYDTITEGEKEIRVVNAEETLAAREKQKIIKQKFREWVFSDPDRTERLVRVYNDTYNALRPRVFEDGHLDFPGMNQSLHLRSHQKDAVWRGMSSGNTLLAHVVGAGKTFTMAATGMKMKQAGLIRKPMYVVPNHLLEQFSREFLMLYPNAKLLVATKEDLARDKRKHLTAKIASGEWDGIVVTHSSFERIGMSKEYQAEFLREQIAEYDALLIAQASQKNHNRNLIKTIEKQKAQREEKLTQLLAADKKDDGLVFDELGVDHIFVDEAHAYKNLETPTKMDRVAGIQTGGSERAFDLYLKARFLGSRQPGHGVTFATGTPISNTMVEMYTMQRFLDPEGLKSRGIEHFDAWAGTFGEVVDAMEIAPDGAGLRPRSRFAKFCNLPELQQMFRQFADVQTADMLDLPRPKLVDGKPIIVACPMSVEQQVLQQELVERYDRLRSERVDPREDNALAITTDGRKLATDARMLDPKAGDFPDSKLNRLIENVVAVHRESTLVCGTQMIFADMGVNPTKWGFSLYDELVEKLAAAGIPRGEIATIGEADSDAKKQSLFEKVRNGQVRVLIGSTQKMGTGTNVQKRLIALHHLDAPWKPAEVEQRDGRILRQGNENKQVQIFRYVTEGSFDAYMWQALETKAKFIGQIITGANALRLTEDIGSQELSYAEVKAIASGNPAVLTLAEADAEYQRLGVLKKNHLDEQYLARRKLRELPEAIVEMQKRLEHLQADTNTLVVKRPHDYEFTGRSADREAAMECLAPILDRLPDVPSNRIHRELGTYRGLRFSLLLAPDMSPEIILEGAIKRSLKLTRGRPGPRALVNALDRLAESYPEEFHQTEQALAAARQQAKDFENRLGQPFEHDATLQELQHLRDDLKAALSSKDDSPPPMTATVERIRTLLANRSPETVERPPTVGMDAEEPVTRRILRRELLVSPSADTDQESTEIPARHSSWVSRYQTGISEQEHDAWHRA